jgi:hypothetical protein
MGRDRSRRLLCISPTGYGENQEDECEFREKNPIAKTSTKVPFWPLTPQHGDPSARTSCSANNDSTIVGLRRLITTLSRAHILNP